jgi:hypothetical protein
MTATELLNLKPEALAAMSDDKLVTYLTPLIPSVRAEYIGRRSEVVQVGEKVVNRREYNRKAKRLAEILAKAQASLGQNE